MNTRDLANIFNTAPLGSNTRKETMKTLASEEIILFIDPMGLIWPKRLSEGKRYSYTFSIKQLIIRDEKSVVVEKISFANIAKMDPSELAAENPVMKLTLN